jgi:hypothetical protein
MPSVKRNVKSEVKKTGFEAYDGPEPTKRAIYRGKIKQLNFKEYNSGAQGFSMLIELEAEKGDPKDHAQFDGYPIWTNLVLGDKEAMQARESNFYAALGAKDEPAIVFEDGDLKGGVKVTSIGGKKNLIDAVVNADIKLAMYEGNLRPEVDGIYKFTEGGIKPKFPSAAEQATDTEEDEDEVDTEVEETEEDDEDAEVAARQEELEAMTLAAIRKVAKGHDIVTLKKTKDELVEAVMDVEYPVAEDDEPMATAADEDDEEAEEDSEEEAEDDEEEDEEEEEEDEDLDASAEDTRKAELAELDRTALKKLLKDLNPAFKVFKTTEDAALRDAIIAAEFGSETPF